MPLTMFMNNQEGLNLTDSPLTIKDTQATGRSYNYDYSITGAITKVLGSTQLNSIADAQLKTLGMSVHHDVTSDARTVLRTAGTKIQTVDPDTGITVNQASDTNAAITDFLASGSAQQVVFSTFNTNVSGTILWMAGGGMGTIYGYTGSKITANGVSVPTGSIGTTVVPTSGGSFLTTGTYFYGVAFRKRSTQALSNVTLDKSATISSTTDTVTIDLTTISNIDTTLYDKIYIYRSAVSGVTAFTTGDLIAKVDSTATSYSDTGSFLTTASNIPRPGGVVDNSTLPAGTYKYCATFKRRLVVCVDSTFYLSDLDKPESWPIENVITVPTGGPLTALGTIGVPSEYTTGADQYLCLWKENDLWAFTGDNIDNWELIFVDKTGCITQSLVVPFNGFISWIAFNGVYIWDGKGKPSRISRPIQALFTTDGDLDKSSLKYGVGAHFKSNNQVIWRLGSRIKGVQTYSLKMDTRLSATQMYKASPQLQNPELDGVFIQDADSNAIYGMTPYKPSNGDELLLMGDDAGFIYSAYNSAMTPVSFDYETRPLDMGIPQNNKRFKRILIFTEKITTNDLSLFFWTDNRIRDEYASVVNATLSPSKGTQPALWDVALWDQAYWDDYTPDISPIEFQLHSNENNAEGSSLKIRLEQLEGEAPVRIHGFAIEWEDMGTIPIPTQQV